MNFLQQALAYIFTAANWGGKAGLAADLLYTDRPGIGKTVRSPVYRGLSFQSTGRVQLPAFEGGSLVPVSPAANSRDPLLDLAQGQHGDVQPVRRRGRDPVGYARRWLQRLGLLDEPIAKRRRR